MSLKVFQNSGFTPKWAVSAVYKMFPAKIGVSKSTYLGSRNRMNTVSKMCAKVTARCTQRKATGSVFVSEGLAPK